MVWTLRAQANARPVVEPEPAAFGLFGRDFQPLTSPDPFDALLVHPPPGAPQQRRDPAIPVAAVLAGKFDDVGSQRGLVITAGYGYTAPAAAGAALSVAGILILTGSLVLQRRTDANSV